MTEQWQPVLDFWFQGETLGNEQISRWWKKDEAVDKWIKSHFSHLIDDVHDHLYQSWSENPKGRLAAIICLDQFSRNAYRGSDQSFRYDARAKELTDEGLTLGHEQHLSLLEQSFFIMPLMHDENLESQERCLSFFERLVDETEGSLREYFSGSLEFGKKHRAIIEQYGRYPHRNQLLGRASTEMEVEFLSQPGSSF